MANVKLTYKKYLNVPAVIIDTFPSEPANTYAVPVTPPWLQLIVYRQTRNSSGKITSYSYKVTLDPQYADNLAPGMHNATVDLMYYADSNNSFAPIFGEKLKVTLEVIDNVTLTLSKTAFQFEHVLGQTPPADQALTVTTDNAWSAVADQPWVTFSESSGNGSKSIFLGVDVAGLPVGLHEATFQVEDGDRIKQGTVSLIISGSDESGDYLNLSRTSISFSEILGEPPTRSATFSVETSLAATITTLVPWLQLSLGAVAAGTQEITVNTTATEALALGSYAAKIKVESGFSTKNIDVLLRIVETETSGIVSGSLYFAKDRNTLILGSATANAEAQIDFSSTASGKTKNYTKRLPFFNNLAEAIIGLETSALLKPENLPSSFESGAFIPVKPLLMDFTIYDKVINSTATSERQSFAQVRFLNGRSPLVENVLSNIPSKIAVPADGLVCFSFYSEVPITQFSITGSVEDTIAITGLTTNVYAVVVKLSNYTLAKGDSITIAAGPVTLQVRIKETQLTTSRLIFLNEWDCPEVFNLDGTIEVIDEDDSTVVSVAQAGRIISRIVEVNEPRSFRMGTGNIFSNTEVKWLAGILRSKKSWLEIDGERIEVVKTFTSLTTSKTRENTRNFILNFDAAVK